jgi:hypothetical protein
MRVRITRRPPLSYGADGESLRVGNVYNLDSSLAAALIADDCAELFETLPDREKLAAALIADDCAELFETLPDRERNDREWGSCGRRRVAIVGACGTSAIFPSISTDSAYPSAVNRPARAAT